MITNIPEWKVDGLFSSFCQTCFHNVFHIAFQYLIYRIPWRVQTIEMTSTTDIDSYGKPLPSPPVGCVWEQKEDGSWVLTSVDKHEILEAATTFENPVVLEHVVLSTDTIQGICLRYRISVLELRRHNIFSGNSIKFLKTLRIPIEPGLPVLLQRSTERDVIMQRFRNHTGESDIETRIYLDEHAWDLGAAIAAWSGDDLWAKAHATTMINTPAEEKRNSDMNMNMNMLEAEEDVPHARGVKFGQTIAPAQIIITASACAAPTSVFPISTIFSKSTASSAVSSTASTSVSASTASQLEMQSTHFLHHDPQQQQQHQQQHQHHSQDLHTSHMLHLPHIFHAQQSQHSSPEEEEAALQAPLLG